MARITASVPAANGAVSIVRLLADARFFDSYEAIGPLALGAALYGVYLALVVILGRTGKTGYNFPVTIVATIAMNRSSSVP